MALSTRWLVMALYAQHGLAVSGGSGTSSSEVTCTDTEVSTNLLANPSWEDGIGSWTYSFPTQTTNVYASDGSDSLYISLGQKKAVEFLSH